MRSSVNSTCSTRRRFPANGSLIGGGAALIAGWSNPRFMLAENSAPIAETHYGKVRGVEVEGVRIFKGVPYGGPTEGAGRFDAALVRPVAEMGGAFSLTRTRTWTALAAGPWCPIYAAQSWPVLQRWPDGFCRSHRPDR